VRITGSLRIAWSADEVEDCRAQLDAMRADDLPAEWYEGPEGTGLLFPRDGVYQPLARCRTLARTALANGARLFENTRALDVAGNCVTTPHGSIQCNAVVVAVDGGLRALLPELSSRVRTARLQMLATAPAPEVHYSRPVYARYGYEYWQQLPDGRITLGGFRDKHIDAEWTDNATPSDALQQMLERHLRDVMHVTAPIEHRWAASVGFTEDMLPVFEEVRPRVWAIGAYSGTGNVIGAACGCAAVRCTTGETGELAALLASPAVEPATRV
jgi:glycine/D-amino acid oxidase-like deaminating enzyme